MSYIPHTETERQAMLDAIGATTIEDLFEAVPASKRFPAIDLPGPLSQMEVADEMLAISEANDHGQDFAIFRGAGCYHHYIPPVVNHILLRSEFYTAYTPYQPELSQGTLQTIFEYQSMMCALTGLDAANASHYDGATGLAESVTVALDAARGKRNKIVLSPNIHPQYREVVRTYHQGRDLRIVGDRGRASLRDLLDMVDENTAMLALQYPNFMGQIEDLQGVADEVHRAGALLVLVVNPIALAILKSPGELGADIAVGEGQPLGIPMSFGGPTLGFFAVRKAHVRRIAGRIVGESRDADGRRAYVMTLRPREQDIKRDRASSNICTNQGLMALAAGVYMATMGRHGMRQAALLSYHKAHYLADQIDALAGYAVNRDRPFFNEFLVKCPIAVEQINAALGEAGIIGGYDIGQDYEFAAGHMMLAVTELNSKEEMDTLVSVLKEVAA